MLRVHTKRGDWQGALAVYQGMQARKVKHDSQVLNMVMGICAAAGKAIEVERLLAEAEAAVTELADVVSYNIVVKAYTLHADYPNAVKVLARMRARRLEPNNITYNSVIDAAARAGEAVAAWELYQDMVACGIQADRYTCSILIKTLSPNPTGDRIRKCLDLLSVVGIVCTKLRTNLYHNVVEAALQLGDAAVLVHSVSQTRQHRVRLTPASCRTLKELAYQYKGPHCRALEAAVGVEGHTLGSALEEQKPGCHRAPPAAHNHDKAKTGEVPMKPQAQVTQWLPRGSTSEESTWLKDEALGGPAASKKPRPSPGMQWGSCKVSKSLV